MERWIDFQQSLKQRVLQEKLDQEQNQVKNFGLNGHALVRGVAGSGKSLVLRDRVATLVEAGMTDILVLTYNRFMQGWIRSNLESKGIHSQVDCKTFHAWAWNHFKYPYTFDQESEKRQKIATLAEKSGIRYQAILIDEAQDFYDEWFVTLLKVLDPNTNSLFFVYDNTQSIYGQPHRRRSDWTWKQLGIDVTGRSQIFDLNYRNSPEILETAWKFVLPALSQANMKVVKREQAQGKIGAIVEPRTQKSRSSGIQPLLIKMSLEAAPEAIAQQVKLAWETHADSSIGILTHPDDRALRETISTHLNNLEIPHHAPTQSRERDGNVVARPVVVVDSWNALKGIEFDAVIVVGIDRVSETFDEEQNFQTKAGLYTAMTRARDHLILLYQTQNSTVEQLENALSAPDQLEQEG